MIYRYRALNCSHGIEMWKYFYLGNGSVQCLFCPSGKKTSLKVWQYQEYCLLLWSELEQAEKNGCDEDSNE